jgi:glutathione synthase/RimK-type ligase-like ATP-grasp enzyme
MTLRLLCIANSAAYATAATDVPLGTARLAAQRGVELLHVETSLLLGAGEEIPCVRIPPDFDPGSFAGLSQRPTSRWPIRAFDLAFDRTLKPFPAGWLERLVALSPEVPFLNDPAGIRRQLEPGFLLEAASDFLPPHRLAEAPDELASFQAAHGTIVAKRTNSCGGRGVFRISPAPAGGLETDNVVEGARTHADAAALWSHLVGEGGARILLMRYLPRVIRGEKRIVVVGGAIQGAYLRRSERGHWVQNVSQGARCERVPVSTGDRALVAATWGPYADAGIRLLGYDLIEDEAGTWRVSEINAGNVGGLFRLETLGEPGLTERFVEFLSGLARRGRAPDP